MCWMCSSAIREPLADVDERKPMYYTYSNQNSKNNNSNKVLSELWTLTRIYLTTTKIHAKLAAAKTKLNNCENRELKSSLEYMHTFWIE